MSPRLLLSGHKPTFDLIEFDPANRSLRCTSSPTAPPSVTWLERSRTIPGIVYASSETEHAVYALSIEGDQVQVVDKRETGCTWPVHFALERDGSALITGGLGSGETAYIPLKRSGSFGAPSLPLLTYPDSYPYHTNNPSPFGARQTGPHVHGLEVDSKGIVYICDLGSDVIWRAKRDSAGGRELRVTGKMGGERGSTPRHCILSPDESYLYVNSELQSHLAIYDTTSLTLRSTTDVTPPHLSRSVRNLLLTAEIYAHPIHRRTLYISLRGSRRMGDMSPYRGIPNPTPPEEEIPSDSGDSIAVVLLKGQGSGVEEVRHFQTGLDWVRGMRITDDGRFLAAAGEYGGGLEIYQISGERGEVFELVTKDESVKDVNCVLWL